MLVSVAIRRGQQAGVERSTSAKVPTGLLVRCELLPMMRQTRDSNSGCPGDVARHVENAVQFHLRPSPGCRGTRLR